MNDEATAIAIPEEEPALTPWMKMSAERKAMLRQVCGGVNLNDAQFGLLMEVAIRSGLDPFRKQLYGTIIKGRFVLITGIDGFRGVMARSGEHVGTTDAIHTYADDDVKKRFPLTSTVTVKRIRHGVIAEFTATARFNEYAKFKDGRPDGNWFTMPHVQLDKCAEALASRKGFTETLGGVYSEAEVDAIRNEGRAAQVRTVTSARALLASETPTETVHEATVEGDPSAEFYESDKGPE